MSLFPDWMPSIDDLIGPNAKPISAEEARKCEAYLRAQKQELQRETERERQKTERERQKTERERQKTERERQKTERERQKTERIRSKLTPKQAAALDAAVGGFRSD